MANKKINQLVLKTTIQSTDLFPLGDPTTGQLFKKTVAELQAAIGGAVISVNGLVGTVVLDTDDIQELATPTNRYFTEARARAAISLTTTGNSGASTYSNSTGVLNVPTYTLAGLGGITASFLSGGTGITYNSGTGVISYSGTVYTDASIRALFSAGTGISYNSSTGAITNSAPDQVVSIAGGSGITVTGTYPSFTVAYSGTVYSDSSIRALFSGTAPITYNSSTGAIGITQASGSTNGFLSSTDWTTFNSKQSALTLGNVTEAVSNVLMFPDGGTNKTIGNLSIQVVQAGSTTNGFLSTTDWNTFNNKQNAITLTTTGTSGAATFSSGTLNIPQYQSVLTNPVTGTGTTNYVTKWISSSAVGNSQIFDNGTAVGIGITTPTSLLHLNASGYPAITIQGGATAGGGLKFLAGSDTYAELFGEYQSANNGVLLFRTRSAGTVAERMRITAAGNVGIGTTTPAGAAGTTLEINGASGQARLAIKNNATGSTSSDGLQIGVDTGGAAFVENRGANSLQLNTNGSARLFITSAGNVGIGTSSPSATIHIVKDGAGNSNTNITGSQLILSRTTGAGENLAFRNTGTSNGISGTNYTAQIISDGNNVLEMYTNAATPLVFGTSATERMRITSGGNILIGTTTDNGERLYVSGSIRATGSITANSDARLKKNIERIENALEKVGQISGYTYNTIYDEDRHAGVIAQEIDKVLPEIVNKGNDGLMGVEYGNISALLIEAIKEQKVLIESLQAKVEALSK